MLVFKNLGRDAAYQADSEGDPVAGERGSVAQQSPGGPTSCRAARGSL